MAHLVPSANDYREDDPLWRMRAVRLAREVATGCWGDAERLTPNEISRRIAGQLYAAVSSIAANLGEGYSRSSGREVVASRLEKLEEIRRLLLAIIPRERGRLIRPKNG